MRVGSIFVLSVCCAAICLADDNGGETIKGWGKVVDPDKDCVVFRSFVVQKDSAEVEAKSDSKIELDEPEREFSPFGLDF